MKVLKDLTATETGAPFRDNHGLLLSLRDETNPDAPRHLTLCADGLVCRRGDAVVAIPKAELWKLAETIDPALALPPAS